MSFVDITVYIGAQEPMMIGSVERQAQIRLQGDKRIVMPILNLLQNAGFLFASRGLGGLGSVGGEEDDSSVAPNALESKSEGFSEETNTK